MTNKRGRLASGQTLSREQYCCVVENCKQTFRGDKIGEHFQRFSKLAVLDDAKKLDVTGEIVNGLNHINTLLVDDENQKKHTVYLLSNGYSSKNLPSWKSDGFRKRKDFSALPAAFSKANFKVCSK